MGKLLLFGCGTRGGAMDFAAQFTGDDKLVAANAGAFSPGANEKLTVAFWFALDALPSGASLELANLNTGVANNDSWFVFVQDVTNRPGMGYTDGTGGFFFLVPAVTLAVDTWYFIVCEWDNNADCDLAMRLYDTEAVINSFSNAGTNPSNATAVGDLNLGGGAAGQAGLTGRMDKAGLWMRKFAGAEADDLWNNGAGLTGAAVDAHGTLNDYLAYYDYDRNTGAVTWPDHGGNFNATATGTVIRVPRAGQF